MADTTKVSFRVAGAGYEVDYNTLTAVDAGDFRRVVGIPLVHAFRNGADLDVIAALVWLVRRRGQRGLTYEEVAESINYGNVEFDTDEAAEAKDPNSPEA